MAGSIVSALFSRVSLKVSPSNGAAASINIWTNLKVHDVEIDSGSVNSEQPIGTNPTSDNTVRVSLLTQDIQASKIIRPTHMKITGFCPDISTFESIANSFANNQQTLDITSKGVIATNMAMVEVIATQSPEMLSATKVEIMLEQAASPVGASGGFSPLQSADASALGISIQTPQTIGQSVQSLYNKATSFISGIF
ncbi:baseplate organization protein [Burkholderia phage vB_BglM_WTB]